MSNIYKANIEKQTLTNGYYRKVLYTTPQLQLVLMNLRPHDEIGMEVHKNTTQFIRIESGTGMAYISQSSFRLKDGDAFIVPPGKRHNVKAGKDGLKLYTLYSPPEHKPDTKQLKSDSM